MAFWITVLLLCQLAGEVFVLATGLPVPGPVCGMALLFCILMARGGVPENLGALADSLLANLSLLFVPAGVGVMLHFKLLAADWMPIAIALVVSTLFTIGVTAALMSALGRHLDRVSPLEEERRP
jgi:putative effector of murein hydrolase LrgA (UPF0299 family)